MWIPILPVPKPRMTQRDRWAKRPAVVRYHTFCDELRLRYKGELPERLYLVIHMPMPKTWSNKKRKAMLLEPHRQRPDIDNLIKAVLDALCEDDSNIHEVHACKLWNEFGGIGIETIEKEPKG
jgi:Holliday junction resolvase RusA-like endonuclease